MNLWIVIVIGIVFLVFAYFIVKGLTKPTKSEETNYGLIAF